MPLRLQPFLLTICIFCLIGSANAQEPFDDWLVDLQQEAVASGISVETAEAVVQHIQLLPNIIQLDRSQPEFISPFLDYYNKRVNAQKVISGRAKLMKHQALLNQLETQFGIPKAYLIAFWGMETNYGESQGNIDTLSTLATLAYEGRRADFFRSQLMQAMRMLDNQHAVIDQWRGSWAGAFGHMQFMPSTFMLYAVDGDGDQRIDLANSEADAFTSAANYLSQVGWQMHALTMIEVKLPDYFDWQSAHLNNRKTVDEWMKLGISALKYVQITAADHPVIDSKPVRTPKNNVNHRKGKKRSKAHNPIFTQVAEPVRTDRSDQGWVIYASLQDQVADMSANAAILLPQGWRGPAFMVFDNFDVIMDWNRSVNYALSVAQLAQRIEQQPAVLGGKQAETGALSFVQMQQLQAMLSNLGFDAGEPDGLPGLQTQAAIRTYQLSQQLPADGYASPSLFHQLNEKTMLGLQ
jgi:membrane-bound lytic murein transglycosylase B